MHNKGKAKEMEKAIQTQRYGSFLSAMEAPKRFGFTIADIAQLIGLTPRTLFRTLAKKRPIEFEDLIQLQTVSLTLQRLSIKIMAEPKYDVRKIAS